jgi:ribonucleoside-triphosphate reductase
MGVVTLNLADVALSSGGDIDRFWELMEERTEMCYRVQKIRIERMRNVKAKVAPILWCDGAFARLDPEETLGSIMFGGRCTVSLGYAALWECTYYMTGHGHYEDEGHDFAIKVMQYLNDRCAEWKAKDHIDFSLYGSPIETTTYKFAKCLRKRFGTVEGVTDKEHVVNSCHIPVWVEVDPFTKLETESEFQLLSPGGNVLYAEAANLQDNPEAVLQLLQHMYEHTMYGEINCKSDYCQCCGFDGEIKLKSGDDGKYYWECPQCGCTDTSKMNIARRVCGYISTNPTSQGRLDDIAKRYVHADDHDDDGE